MCTTGLANILYYCDNNSSNDNDNNDNNKNKKSLQYGMGLEFSPSMMNWIILKEWLTDERRLHLVSSRNHCQRFSLSHISDTLRAGFDPVHNMSSDFVVQ